MRAILLALAALAASRAATLHQYASLSLDPDSAGPAPGRRQVLWTGLLDGGSWDVRLTDRYLDADSGGLVPRRFLGRNDLLLDAGIRFGALTALPSFRLGLATGDGLDFVLPSQEGTVLDRSYARPALGLTAALPSGFSVSASGSLVERGLEHPDGTSLAWSGETGEGDLRWTSRSGVYISTGGTYRAHSCDDISFETDWTGIGAAVGTAPVSLPARVQVTGELGYRVFSGEDYLGRGIPDRLSCRIRAARWFAPGISLNVGLLASADRTDDGWVRSTSSGAARLVLTKGRPGAIPSQLTIGAQFTGSTISTARFEVSGRLHLTAGLSLLASVDARRTPTSVPAAGPDRERISLGSGLEYRFGSLAVAWIEASQERTRLAEVEVWPRLEAGVEFWPPALEI